MAGWARTLPSPDNTNGGKILVTDKNDAAWRGPDRTTQLTTEPAHNQSQAERLLVPSGPDFSAASRAVGCLTLSRTSNALLIPSSQSDPALGSVSGCRTGRAPRFARRR
jgi:hypothetical protein